MRTGYIGSELHKKRLAETRQKAVLSGYIGSEKHKRNIEAARLRAQEGVSCPHCSRKTSRGGLARHMSVCPYDDANARHCPACDTRLYKTPSHGTFCSIKCSKSPSFNNPKNKIAHPVSFVCKGCKQTKTRNKNAQGIYCDSKCQAIYTWETITKPSIMRGERTRGPSLRRFCEERDGPGCSSCGVVEWLGEPMTMDVDHIDGDHTNNMPDNFRLLCPNCHRQTPTWGKKNSKIYGSSSLRHSPVK